MNMDFQENTFQYNSVSINYFEKGSGKPILFLQGGGVRVFTYKNVLDSLSEKYLVIAPELPCFGGSTVPKEVWGLKEYASFFDEFIKSLNLKEFTTIGHSLGGGIALILASKNEKIKNLILIDSAGKSNGYSETKFRYKFYIEKTFYDLFHYKNFSTCLLIIKDFFKNRIKKSFQWSHIVKIMKKCLLTDFDESHKIKARTLILWGDQDEIFSPESAKIINKEIPGSTLKFVRGNHDWCLFKRNELLELIDQWFEKKEFAVKEID